MLPRLAAIERVALRAAGDRGALVVGRQYLIEGEDKVKRVGVWDGNSFVPPGRTGF